MPNKKYCSEMRKELKKRGFPEEKINRLLTIECGCGGSRGLTGFVQMFSESLTPLQQGVQKIKKYRLQGREARLYLDAQLKEFQRTAINPPYLNFL